MMKNVFGGRITEARTAKKMTRKSLAESIDVSPSLITNYENGDRLPSVEKLAELAQKLGVSADYLLGINQEYEFKMDDELRQLLDDIKCLGIRDRKLLAGLVKLMKV